MFSAGTICAGSGTETFGAAVSAIQSGNPLFVLNGTGTTANQISGLLRLYEKRMAMRKTVPLDRNLSINELRNLFSLSVRGDPDSDVGQMEKAQANLVALMGTSMPPAYTREVCGIIDIHDISNILFEKGNKRAFQAQMTHKMMVACTLNSPLISAGQKREMSVWFSVRKRRLFLQNLLDKYKRKSFILLFFLQLLTIATTVVVILSETSLTSMDAISSDVGKLQDVYKLLLSSGNSSNVVNGISMTCLATSLVPSVEKIELKAVLQSDAARYVLILLPVLFGALSAFYAMQNPRPKIAALQYAVAALEREEWLFQMQVGEYTILSKGGQTRKRGLCPREILVDNSEAIIDQLLKSGVLEGRGLFEDRESDVFLDSFNEGSNFVNGDDHSSNEKGSIDSHTSNDTKPDKSAFVMKRKHRFRNKLDAMFTEASPDAASNTLERDKSMRWRSQRFLRAKLRGVNGFYEDKTIAGEATRTGGGNRRREADSTGIRRAAPVLRLGTEAEEEKEEEGAEEDEDESKSNVAGSAHSTTAEVPDGKSTRGEKKGGCCGSFGSCCKRRRATKNLERSTNHHTPASNAETTLNDPPQQALTEPQPAQHDDVVIDMCESIRGGGWEGRTIDDLLGSRKKSLQAKHQRRAIQVRLQAKHRRRAIQLLMEKRKTSSVIKSAVKWRNKVLYRKSRRRRYEEAENDEGFLMWFEENQEKNFFKVGGYYIRKRLKPLVAEVSNARFWDHNWYVRLIVLVLVMSATSSVLAALGFTHYIPATVVLTATFEFCMQYKRYDKVLLASNLLLVNLAKKITWWNGLTEAALLVTSNREGLVLEVEDMVLKQYEEMILDDKSTEKMISRAKAILAQNDGSGAGGTGSGASGCDGSSAGGSVEMGGK